MLFVSHADDSFAVSRGHPVVSDSEHSVTATWVR
ncbi:hypothetical protein SFR_3931 [Streptomyces sp. FR-008]|nr:hypothetical protein SFR_3931 [Streptomyces sp. FR-008]